MLSFCMESSMALEAITARTVVSSEVKQHYRITLGAHMLTSIYQHITPDRSGRPKTPLSLVLVRDT